MVRERKYSTKSGRGRGVATLLPAFVFAFAVAVALPVSIEAGFSLNGAFAAGNGKALGKTGAPGQQNKDQVADADEHAIASGGAVSGLGADSTGAGETVLVPVDPGNKVVQELAGLPDSSALSEEEELEAIRSGWGNWRTADGPNSIMAQ